MLSTSQESLWQQWGSSQILTGSLSEVTSPYKPAWDSQIRPFWLFLNWNLRLKVRACLKQPIIKAKAGQIKEFFW